MTFNLLLLDATLTFYSFLHDSQVNLNNQPSQPAAYLLALILGLTNSYQSTLSNLLSTSYSDCNTLKAKSKVEDVRFPYELCVGLKQHTYGIVLSFPLLIIIAQT